MKLGFPHLEFNSQSAKLSAIIESTKSIIYAVDSLGNYLIFNDSHRKMMWACYQIEVDPKVTWKETNLYQPDRLKLAGFIHRALTGEQFRVVEEFGNPLFKRCWFEVNYNPIRDEFNRVTGVAVFLEDVTERIALEKDLRAAKESAETDAKAKSTFLSNMSHEIRTPMNAILGLTELLLYKKLDVNTIENLKAIQFSANNLLTIINDILDFSKIEAGKLSFEIQAFDLLHVLEDLNRSVSVSATAKNLVYEVNMSGAIPKYLKGDSVRLSQILLNLLGNSVKFTQTGKVKLTVDVLNETETDLVLEFKVSDTGIGIPKDQMQSIFHSFSRVESPQKYKTQGTGLGLSITKHLVEMQMGQIRVDSQVGKGSTFTFFLPYLKVKANELSQTPVFEDIGKVSFNEMKVLLVEDNKINQMLARQILQGWNVNVDIADDGFEAIAKLQRYKFDLILLDLQMPEIDGFEVARFVRKTMKSPSNKIPIVALTADAFPETRELTLQAGMNDFITKPYRQRDLFRVLRRFSGMEMPASIEKQNRIEEVEIQKINFEYVREKFGKDQETFRYILEVFKNEIGEEIQSIRPFFDSNEVGKATKLIHKLVSTFTAMGMPETAIILSTMERQLKQGEDPQKVVEMLAEVEHSYRQALEQIQPILDSIGLS